MEELDPKYVSFLEIWNDWLSVISLIFVGVTVLLTLYYFIRLSSQSDPKDKHDFIKITDNGCGIRKENLIRIFNHGFTTKKDGHGFGLHACANSMTEMKGSLTAESEGVNKGTTFTITLPALD